MKIKSICGEVINFDNDYRLSYYHEQDCCECVYADFWTLHNYNVSLKTGKKINIEDIDFEETLEKLIQKVEDAGFNMVAKNGEKFFVPCYDEQNGYYSSNLKLILEKCQPIDEKDISGCTEFKERL